MANEDGVLGDEDAPKKKSKLPMILGIFLFLVLGAGGFFAVYSGMILAPASMADKAEEDPNELEVLALPEVAFIPIPPLVINMTSENRTRHLKFSAQLEVVPEFEAAVTELMPRVVDVLNGYLRAVSVEELEKPSALIRLRGQMLRRVQIVTGEGRIRDLLIMEFVIN